MYSNHTRLSCAEMYDITVLYSINVLYNNGEADIENTIDRIVHS